MVRVSNTKAAKDNFVDNGVDEKERMEDKKWERIVVLPEPDSPLLARIVSSLFRRRPKRLL